MATDYPGPDRRSEMVVDTEARHEIHSHIDVCAERYDALKRKLEDMNLEIRDLRMDHKSLSVKLDGFMRLVYVSTIALSVALAMAFGAAAWNSKDRFTGTQAHEMKQELKRDIERVR